MSLLAAILLGIVQGLTEFLPVSSSGHLVLGQVILGIEEHSVTFDVLVHVATLLAVFIYFREDLRSITSDALKAARGQGGKAAWLDPDGPLPGARLALLVAIGTIPAGIAGLFLEDFFKALFENLRAVAGFFLVTSVLLFLTWRKSQTAEDATYRRPGADATLTPGRVVAIGIAQAAAICPGISRAGATIATGLVAGVSRETAARFSFVLSIPAIAGAMLLEFNELRAVPPELILPYAAGFIAALLSGLGALTVLMRVVRSGALHFFGIYTAALAVVSLLFSL